MKEPKAKNPDGKNEKNKRLKRNPVLTCLQGGGNSHKHRQGKSTQESPRSGVSLLGDGGWDRCLTAKAATRIECRGA